MNLKELKFVYDSLNINKEKGYTPQKQNIKMSQFVNLNIPEHERRKFRRNRDT